VSDPSAAPELRLLDTLFRLNKSVLADARTHVAAAADLDLADFLVLRTVELGVDTPGGLIRDLGLNPAVVSRALTKLTKAGLIERRIDSEDSRRSRVDLTKKGARTTAAIATRMRPGLAQRLGHLDPDQVQALVESLEAL
jgi:DNA-binding MarR family transcriptional regulator